MFEENSDLAAINHNFDHFVTYNTVTGYEITPEATMLAGLKDIYRGIPDNCVFVIYASFNGTLVRLDGIKATDQYSKITAYSYADAANVTYVILAGAWTKR